MAGRGDVALLNDCIAERLLHAPIPAKEYCAAAAVTHRSTAS